MKLIPRHYIEEIRWHTKELTKVLQEYACQGEKTTLPEDDELRRKICAYNLRVSTRIIKEVKENTQLLQTEIDLLEQLYLKKTKVMRQVMVKELDALEEEVRYFQAMFDAEIFVNTLHDRVLECEIELSRLERRKLFNSLRKNSRAEHTSTKLAIKEDTHIVTNTRRTVVDSPLSAVNKLQQDSSKTVISSLKGNGQSFAATEAELSQDISLEKADPEKENNKQCDRIDQCYTNKALSVCEVPLQVMLPTATTKVERADIEDGKSVPSNSTTSIQSVNASRINCMCHNRCTNFNISIETCFQPSASGHRYIHSCFVDIYTVEAIRSARQRPLLYPDKRRICEQEHVLTADGQARSIVLDCGMKGKCLNGQCVLDIEFSIAMHRVTCAEDEMCRDGECKKVADTFCLGHADCGPDMECRTNRCKIKTPEPICNCQPHEICHHSQCYPNSQCTSNYCGKGSYCVDGKCVNGKNSHYSCSTDTLPSAHSA